MNRNFHTKAIILLMICCLLTASAGCYFNRGGKIDYDILLSLKKSHMPAADRIIYNTYGEYTDALLGNKQIKGSHIILQCLSTDYYHVLYKNESNTWHFDGKCVVKYKILSMGRTYNDISSLVGKVMTFEQECYITPSDEESFIKTIKSLGGDMITDEQGAMCDISISEGEYPFKYLSSCEYELISREDVLPMEAGQEYTALLCEHDGKYSIGYFLPVDDIERYSDFKLTDYYINFANEIKDSLITN